MNADIEEKILEPIGFGRIEDCTHAFVQSSVLDAYNLTLIA